MPVKIEFVWTLPSLLPRQVWARTLYPTAGLGTVLYAGVEVHAVSYAAV